MPYVAALAAGLLLFAADHPLRLWPLTFVAFVPFWWALAAHRAAGRRLWPLGLCFAAGHAGPLLAVVGLAPPILIAAAAVVPQWLATAMVGGRLLARGPVLGAIGAAVMLTLIEVTIWYAVPVFGTAQCFARPMSAAPAAVAFVAWTGVGGLVFVLTAVQALVVAALRGPRRGAPLAVAGALIAAVAVLDVVRWNRQLGAPIRVAALGYNRGPTEELDRSFASATARGARLVVTPETGVYVQDRERSLRELRAAVRANGIAAAVGVWHQPTDDNRIWFFDADGGLRGEYSKTHLVPIFEDYTPGDGTPVTTSVGDIVLGGMICQDDNFPDVARSYGRRAVPLLAVPTNDWPEIREFHLENSLFRAIENGYAVVRAASNGISAIVSPRGEVVARHDHVVDGARLVVADVPTGGGEVTFYARFGDWPVVGSCVLLVLLAALRLRRAPASTTG